MDLRVLTWIDVRLDKVANHPSRWGARTAPDIHSHFASGPKNTHPLDLLAWSPSGFPWGHSLRAKEGGSFMGLVPDALRALAREEQGHLGKGDSHGRRTLAAERCIELILYIYSIIKLHTDRDQEKQNTNLQGPG